MAMPVAQAIVDLRNELSRAESEGKESKLHFEITEVELELQLVLGSEASAGGKVGWGVLSFGAGGKTSGEKTHRLKLSMKVLGPNGGPIPIAQGGARPKVDSGT
jgi:hypothetical protein